MEAFIFAFILRQNTNVALGAAENERRCVTWWPGLVWHGVSPVRGF